jgi:ribosomal protein S18 acetylase RimI-like enzyme/8-oxo-dGTP pyrophosphatase MutT (NUDIX family)
MILEINQKKLTDEVKKRILNGFGQQAIESTGINGLNEESISFEIFDGTEFVGAIVVQPFWGQLHIKYLFVEKRYRGQGIARALMNHALEFGKKRRYSFAFVETMSFQAPIFYQKMGFTIDFTRAGYAKHTMFHYLKKSLEGTPEPMKISRVGVYGVVKKGKKILVVRQKSGPFAGKLDFPGGGIEFGESPEFALRREFAEELAMEFDSLQLIDNLTTTVNVQITSSDIPHEFHQIGMIYGVNGCRLINGEKQGDLQHIWTELTFFEEDCSKLLWKWRAMQ